MPGNTMLTNTNPPLDGTKVSCSCMLDFSAAGQDAGVPARIGPVLVEACVPVNFADAGADLESETCQQLAQPFLKVLTAQVVLSAKPPINSAVVCGWAVGLDPDAAVLPSLVTVTCAAQPFASVPGHPLRVSSPSCQDPMGMGCQPFTPCDTSAGGNCPIPSVNAISTATVSACLCNAPVDSGGFTGASCTGTNGFDEAQPVCRPTN